MASTEEAIVNSPALPDTRSFDAFQRELAAVQPIAETYLAAVAGYELPTGNPAPPLARIITLPWNTPPGA